MTSFEMCCDFCEKTFRKEYNKSERADARMFIVEARKNGWKISPEYRTCPDCYTNRKEDIKRRNVEKKTEELEKKKEKKSVHADIEKYCKLNNLDIDCNPVILGDVMGVIWENLSKKEREVFVLREVENLTFDKIKEKIGVSKQRAQVIENTLIKKVIKFLNCKK